ncbi:MAG: Coenzyme F420 hydrogenase/dehydrogenase, beta subunit C-terminal domain, partial [Oscillospiraceae bacterium]
MKTGLITFYHIHHYGAVLQACATARAVANLGSDCEILNYYVNQDNALLHKPTTPGALLSDAHTALHYGALKTRYDRFEDFARRFLPVAARQYESFDALQNAELPYDVYLSGSDQIWNPKIFPDGKFDPVYFAAFTEGRKISYAPSFGIPRLPTAMEEELAGYLKSYTAISVRERQGQRIVEEATERQATVVLDPTLLLRREDWRTMAEEPSLSGGYILCYCISKPGALLPYVRALAEKTGLPVIQLCGIRQKLVPKAKCVLDAGPAEFLGLFQNATYVCTNSFHGTVFSVQFGKPFFTAVAPMELAAPEQSRTYNLLTTLGLTHRIIGKGDTADLLAPIDYDGVNARLEIERQRSLTFLQDALMGQETAGESSAQPQVLPHLAAKNACTGCAACANGCPKNAIAMQPDREGFLVPVVDHSLCIQCGHCTAICPILQPAPEQGRLPAVFAAWNRDETVRKDSTSGGIFSLLADYVLEDGGVVFGAAIGAGMRVRHIACWKKEELRYLRGAKYVQSEIGDTYRQIKKLTDSGRSVLFAGTPCQVDGLYHYLGCHPDKLLTCDLVCHGVPSPGVWADMVQSIEKNSGKKLQTVRFRNKVNGWKNSHFTTLFEGGAVDSHPLMQTEYGRGFGRALFLRPSCHRCPYASLNRPGDFTLGDFWGLRDDELPEEQSRGIGLLLVNTARGSHIFDQLPIAKKPYTIERAIAGNPRLASPTPMPPERAAFFAAYALEPFEQVRREFLKPPSLPYRAAAKLLSP